MAEFDPLKAAREELAGFVEVARSIQMQTHVAEEAMGKAEKQLNDLRKIHGAVKIIIEECRGRIDKLEAAQQK